MIPPAAHVLAEDACRSDAADHVRGEVAVQDAEPVVAVHRPRGAGADGLPPEAVVERAGDLALPVEHHRALLDAAHGEHRAQEPYSVLQRKVRYVGRSRFGRHLILSHKRDPGSAGSLSVPAARAGSPPRGLPCSGEGYPPRGGGAALAHAAALADARRMAVAGLLRPHAHRRRAHHAAAAVWVDTARSRGRPAARRLREPAAARGGRAARRPPAAPPPRGPPAVHRVRLRGHVVVLCADAGDRGRWHPAPPRGRGPRR